MSEEIKKAPVDIADKDLDEVAGGGAGDGVGGVDFGLRKKPHKGDPPETYSTLVPKPPAAKAPAGSGG